MTKVAVQKNVKLQEGEELWDFVNKVHEAVAQHREKTSKSVFLRGIFKGFIITRDYENGKFFQMKLNRDKEGLVKLGDPVEVRQAFVPVGAPVAKNEGDEISTVDLPTVTVMVSGGKLTKESVDSLEEIVKTMTEPQEDADFVEVEKGDPDASFGDVLGLA